MKQAVLKNVANSKENFVFETLFNKFAGLTATLLKRDTSTGVSLIIFPAILKNLCELLLLRIMW